MSKKGVSVEKRGCTKKGYHRCIFKNVTSKIHLHCIFWFSFSNQQILSHIKHLKNNMIFKLLQNWFIWFLRNKKWRTILYQTEQPQKLFADWAQFTGTKTVTVRNHCTITGRYNYRFTWENTCFHRFHSSASQFLHNDRVDPKLSSWERFE